MKHTIRRFCTSLAAGFLAICSVQGTLITMAKASDEQIRNDVTRAIQEMEAIMQGSYDNARAELSKQCADGYDYELSLESFDEQGLPFAGYDYQEFIAIYATIQQHCFKNNEDLKEGINSIDFVHMDTVPADLYEYIPEKTDKYVQNEDGTYSLVGTTYITEPGNIYTYTAGENNTYLRTGTEYHDLAKTQTPYLEVSLSTVTPEEIYATFGLNREDFLEEETTRLSKLKEIIGRAELSQLTFIKSDTTVSAEDNEILSHAIAMSDTASQQILVSIAGSLLGRIPYEWGGKSDKAGFDDSWYIFDESARQKGLDCSGYIQWILRTAGFEGWDSLVNTSDFLSSDKLYPISAQDLQPGDMGLFYPDSKTRTNHIGMYLGDGYWIHCSSSAGTVVITNNSKFSIYRRLNIFNPQTFVLDSPIAVDVTGYADQITGDSESQTPVLTAYEEQTTAIVPTEEQELMLMAKIVTCEAYGEGYNGWVAVAQVIKNRTLMPDKFPDTVTGVVSENKQFTSYGKASRMADSAVDPNVLQVCRKVLAGELGIFDQPDVIGFKRAVTGDEHWNGWSKYTTLGNHDFYTLN